MNSADQIFMISILLVVLCVLFWRLVLALAAGAVLVVIFIGVLTLVVQGQALVGGS